MASLATIFSWFQKDDIPTEEQFQQTFSSFFHKDEKVPFDSVNGLTQAFQNTVSSTGYENFVTETNNKIAQLAKLDASNLTPDDIISWKEALEITNIATVDSAPDVSDGNVYNKPQVNEMVATLHQRCDDNASKIDEIKATLASDDVNLDELQEVVNYIKENREDIEALQAVIIGATTDDKITLIGNYGLWGAITLQNQFNDALFNKVNAIEEKLDVGKIKHRQVIQVNTTINHQMQAEDVVVVAKDTVTNFYVPVRSQFVDLDNTRIEFDDLPVNPLEIIIKKI